MEQKPWTEEEINFLISNFARLPKGELVKRLGRSWDAIRRRAYRLGLKRPTAKWSVEDITFLSENYVKLPKHELVEKLRRSWSTIKQKAAKLGLKRIGWGKAPRGEYFFWSEEEIRTLKELYPFAPKEEVLRALPLRDWKSIMAKACELGIERKAPKFYPKKLELEETVKAYIAGLFDGEGTVRIAYQRRKHRRGGIHIGIANTNLEALEWTHAKLGIGRIETGKRKSEHWRTCYYYTITDMGEAYGFLESIKPYVIIKKKHASLALEWLEIQMKKTYSKEIVHDSKTGRIIGVRPLRTKRETEIEEELKRLNAKGRNKGQ
jgi:hypothetical protein